MHKVRHIMMAAALTASALTGCAPSAPGPEQGFVQAPSSDASTQSPDAAASSPRTIPPTPAVPAKASRLYSQTDVESMVGVFSDPGGGHAVVLSGETFWKENWFFHFNAGGAKIKPAECADTLAWATLMTDNTPAAGTFRGTSAEPVFLAVTADRDDLLSLAFSSVSKLPDCSPVRLTSGNNTATATYLRASAFTNGGLTYAVIARLAIEGKGSIQFLRVAAKSGTLFVQAIAEIKDADNYRATADRLTSYINNVFRGQDLLGKGLDPRSGARLGKQA